MSNRKTNLNLAIDALRVMQQYIYDHKVSNEKIFKQSEIILQEINKANRDMIWVWDKLDQLLTAEANGKKKEFITHNKEFIERVTKGD